MHGTPCFNSDNGLHVENWLEFTLESAVSQAYKSIEVIVLDDGSSDHTYDVAKRFESRRVQILCQGNKRVCQTRNKLMDLAQGEYLQFLDAGDLLHPQKLEAQITAAETTDAERTFFTASFGTFYRDINKAKFNPDSLWQDLSPLDWMLNKFNDNVWMNPTSWLIPRFLARKGGEWITHGLKMK